MLPFRERPSFGRTYVGCHPTLLNLSLSGTISFFQKRHPGLNFQLPKIYPITDRRLSGLSHAEQVRRLVDGGARLVQLREKHLPSKLFYEEAVEAIKIARAANVRIVVNDRVDIALMAGADGVHLGQDDLPPSEARKILGPGAIIGYSTHSLEQALAAAREPVDYIAAGPVFATSSKADHDPAIGLDGLRLIREAASGLPLVAIGSITADRLRQVLDAGADATAVIGAAVSDASRITERMKELTALAG